MLSWRTIAIVALAALVAVTGSWIFVDQLRALTRPLGAQFTASTNDPRGSFK